MKLRKAKRRKGRNAVNAHHKKTTPSRRRRGVLQVEPGLVRCPGCYPMSKTVQADLRGRPPLAAPAAAAHYPLAADTRIAYLAQPMEFGWDPAKHEKNLRDRGIGFVRAARIFEGFVVEWIDSRRDYGGVRINAIGMADGELLRVT